LQDIVPIAGVQVLSLMKLSFVSLKIKDLVHSQDVAQIETSNLRQVIAKVITVTKNPDEVFRYFSNVKNMEIGNAIKSVTKRKVGRDN
jgi:hypothetical protein